MAGGENAEYAPCGKCSAKAIRVTEGIETDWYRCTECAAEFGIDWDVEGPPDEPCWPPSEEWLADFRRYKEVMKADQKK